jgi:hypothetical protein
MRRCKGYQIKKFGGTLQEKSERLQLIQRIEDRLSYLNVFFFFKDIFQGNRREKVNGEADVGNKTWVFSNPMDSEPWGRQQSIIPIELITKYVANGKELKTQVKSLVDLAAQGCLWTRHPSYGLMRGPAFKKALLEAIKANKDDPNVCHTWKFAEGAYKPPGSNKYTGEKLKEGKATSIGAASGAVAGLVAITPACANVTPGFALLLGVLAGILSALAVDLKFKFGFDDSLDVVGIHLVAGLFGTLYLGFFATDTGLFTGGDFGQLLVQTIAAFGVLIYSFVVALIIGFAIEKTIGFRVKSEEEIAGVDIVVHGEAAYSFGQDPDKR